MEITYSMTIIAMIFLAFILGSINALFSYFLDFCFWEGNVFGFWQPFLAKTLLKAFKPNIYLSLEGARKNKNPEYSNMCIEQAHKMFLYKILGGCPPCTNVWIGFITFPIINHFLQLGGFYSIPYLLMSSFVLRKIMKI